MHSHLLWQRCGAWIRNWWYPVCRNLSTSPWFWKRLRRGRSLLMHDQVPLPDRLGYHACFNRCLSQMPLLQLLIFRVPHSPLLIALWRQMVGMVFHSRCSRFIVLLFFGSIHILLFETCFFLFGFLGYFVLLGLLFCYDTMPPSPLAFCILVILQMNAGLNCYLVNF